ncbi:uncharacterized protein LOC132750726 isoform X1 [Ruditapes philippinarum]|uniref:uncharacterized protein LOC132750726 isoform X1 n=1 Tax=Ruditapes philippinarum TaxID=129788 RepID=UPI00295B1193|nr:uncharacterized protein LOC132750726 isoform X1 [Ruditapes philippinarum]
MIFQIFVVCAIFQQAFGHGWMREPVSRSSAWRLGFPTPRNFNDDNLACGGFLAMMSYGGKCGICGDPWVSENAIRDNEAGGKYATGTIVKSYTMGETINIKINLIANHGGWMEFRICPNNDVRKRVTKECLERHVLQRADGTGTKTIINDRRTGVWTMAYKLPENMVSSQCVIQWKYHTGSSYGMDKDTGKYCSGCGDQEEFYGCADVAIVPNQQIVNRVECKAINDWAGNSYFDRICADSCARGNCPSESCKCVLVQKIVTPSTSTPTTVKAVTHARKICRAIGSFAGNDVFDIWCTNECNGGVCPKANCECTEAVDQPTTSTTTRKPDVTSLGKCGANGSVGSGDRRYWDKWCQGSCDRGICERTYCTCASIIDQGFIVGKR